MFEALGNGGANVCRATALPFAIFSEWHDGLAQSNAEPFVIYLFMKRKRRRRERTDGEIGTERHENKNTNTNTNTKNTWLQCENSPNHFDREKVHSDTSI